MLSLLLAVFLIQLLYRLGGNLLDLALIGLQRWLERRRIPQRMRQVRADLELQRAAIPDQVRASCDETECPHAEEHIVEQLARFDARLPELLANVERQFRSNAGELKVTSSWQLFALLAEPDVRVQQFRNVATLLLPSSRN